MWLVKEASGEWTFKLRFERQGVAEWRPKREGVSGSTSVRPVCQGRAWKVQGFKYEGDRVLWRFQKDFLWALSYTRPATLGNFLHSLVFSFCVSSMRTWPLHLIRLFTMMEVGHLAEQHVLSVQFLLSSIWPSKLPKDQLPIFSLFEKVGPPPLLSLWRVDTATLSLDQLWAFGGSFLPQAQRIKYRDIHL